MFNYRWRLLELSALRLLSASLLMRQLTLAFKRIGKARIVPVGSALIDFRECLFSSEVTNRPPPTARYCITAAGSNAQSRCTAGTSMYIAGGARFQLRIFAFATRMEPVLGFECAKKSRLQ
jgi:hypothetical protein